MKVAAIVLAAGEARRMGRQKLVLPYAGSTVIAHIVDQLIAAEVERVVVVQGANKEDVEAALAGRKVQFIANPDISQGMLSSVRCGLKAAPHSDAYLICLGDQPALRTDTVNKLLETHDQAGHHDGGIFVPVHKGRRGHPLLFSSVYRDEVLSEFDDAGLRGLLDRYADHVVEVPDPSRGVLEDIDTPEDYAAARKAWEKAQG